MKNPFAPYGVSSFKIILNLAREEFGSNIRDKNSCLSLKEDIVHELKKMKPDEQEEKRINTLVGIEHLKQNDFSNFISVRLAYWGMIIAICVMLIGEKPIYAYFNMSKSQFGSMVITLLAMLLYSMSRTINKQHAQMEYLNFKLMCFEELKQDKRKP